MKIVELTKENFEEQVLQAEMPVLVDFWALWCSPCRMVGPVLEEIAQERTSIKVGKVNVDDQPSLAAMYNITSIPTLLLFKNGKVVKKQVGAVPKDMLLAMLDE